MTDNLICVSLKDLTSDTDDSDDDEDKDDDIDIISKFCFLLYFVHI